MKKHIKESKKCKTIYQWNRIIERDEMVKKQNELSKEKIYTGNQYHIRGIKKRILTLEEAKKYYEKDNLKAIRNICAFCIEMVI